MSDAVQTPEAGQDVRRPGTLHPAAEPREHDAPPRRLPDDEDREPREGRELVNAAARTAEGHDKLSQDEQADALEWFLSDEGEEVEDTIEINVGSRSKPKWVRWTVRAVDQDKLRRIRREASSRSRTSRITGQSDLDTQKANVQIVIEGTVYPDLRGAAREIGTVDPAVAVRARFKRKPGLIDQIAGEIMSLSGYDDEDVREVDAARG